MQSRPIRCRTEERKAPRCNRHVPTHPARDPATNAPRMTEWKNPPAATIVPDAVYSRYHVMKRPCTLRLWRRHLLSTACCYCCYFSRFPVLLQRLLTERRAFTFWVTSKQRDQQAWKQPVNTARSFCFLLRWLVKEKRGILCFVTDCGQQ